MKGVVAHFGKSEVMDIRLVREWAAVHRDSLAFTPEEIVAASADWPEWDGPLDESGIYFLLRRGRVCYIGKANALITRLSQHSRQRRPFDAVTVIAGIPQDWLTAVETAYLKAWNPPWNSARGTGYMRWCDPLVDKLKAMPLDLICTLPEQPPLTGAEIERICAALDF